MGHIVRPPTLYLDTNHLIFLDQLGRNESVSLPETRVQAYRKLRTWWVNGRVTLAAYQAMFLEWVEGCPNDRNAQRLLRVLESAENVRLVEADRVTYKVEAIRELQRQSLEFPLHFVDIVRERDATSTPLGELLKFDPELIEMARDSGEQPANLQRLTPSQLGEQAFHWSTQNVDLIRERDEGWAQEFEDSKQAIGSSRISDLAHAWINKSLGIGDVLRAVHPTCNVEECISKIDLNECPAISLYLEALGHYLRARPKAKKNDAMDWSRAHIPAYVDFCLFDKEFTSYLLRAQRALEVRVTGAPEAIVEAVGEWCGAA